MTDAEAAMDRLRRKFLERAQADCAALTEALERMDRAALQVLAHGLAGIAGIFGHAAVGERAAAVEEGVDEGVEDAVLADRTLALVASLEAVGRARRMQGLSYG